jgi:hypothetical protein
MPCVKCGGRESGGKPTHIARSCKSSTELRPKCFCSLFGAVMEWCGKYVTPTEWARGYCVHNACTNADEPAIVARVGTQVSKEGQRAILLKLRHKPKAGTGAVRDAARDAAEKRGEARRDAEGGESGPSSKKKYKASTDDMEQDHVDRLKAASKTERDGRGCLAVANVYWDLVDAASSIAPRLRVRPSDPSAEIMRERNGDPTVRRKDEPTPETVTRDTIRAIDSLVYWMKMVRDGLFVQCLDVENQRAGGDNYKAVEQKAGLGAAYASICWESALSEALCDPNAPITRRAYACVDTSKNTYEKYFNKAKKMTIEVVISGPTLSKEEQQAVVQSRDPRYPITIQKGPELKLAPWLLGFAVAIWDMVDAMNRACGHEHSGANNKRITMPVNSDFLGWVFDRKFEHRAEPDTRDEIYFCRELGLALYWKLKKDPNSRVDEIIDERFPGTDPTKWDFSSFMRSAAATPSKKRKRAKREPLAEQSESEGEDGWDSDEHLSDNE